jgi:glycosyltransferase involved in cell wall biosynthesis
MKTSLICTVLNEEATIKNFLNSIAKQTRNPEEIIIVDGGSTDKTLAVIASSLKTAKQSPPIKIIFKKGNRSIGRNEAVKQAKGDIILCSDAGCLLDKDWTKSITEPFTNSDVDVVAGYYKGDSKTLFQKCLIPYVLIMPDKINPNNFLPASRSMAFKKTIWKKVKGFNEKYSHNEDYVFAKDLKKINAKIVFKKDAIVNWIPRDSLRQSFYMFYRFAYGDAEARIFRSKVMLIFARYIIALLLAIFYIINRSPIILDSLFIILVLYILWAINKNYKYVRHIGAFIILPVIQFTSDLAVITGTTLGIFRLLNNYNR